MATAIAEIGFIADSTQLNQASAALDRVSQAANRAQNSARSAAQGMGAVANAANGAASANERVAQSATGATQAERQRIRVQAEAARAVNNTAKAEADASKVSAAAAARKAKQQEELNALLAEQAKRDAESQARVDALRKQAADEALERDRVKKAAEGETEAKKRLEEQNKTLEQSQAKVNQTTTQAGGIIERFLTGGIRGFATQVLGLSAGISLVDSALRKWIPWVSIAQTSLRGLADILPRVAQGVAFVAAGLAVLASPLIITGIIALGRAIWTWLVSAVIALMSPFIAIPLLVTAALASIWVFNDNIKKALGLDILGTFKNVFNFIVGGFVGVGNVIVYLWDNAGAMAAAGIEKLKKEVQGYWDWFVEGTKSIWSKLPTWMRGSGGAGELVAPLRGTINPFAQVGRDWGAEFAERFAMGFETDFAGKLAGAVQRGSELAADGLRKLADWLNSTDKNYQKLIRNAQKRIEQLRAEQQAIGMTADQAAILKNQTNLLADAQARNIQLTPKMREMLMSLGTTMGTLEVQIERTRATFDFTRDVVGGFVRDLRDGLKNGEGFLKAFANAAVNILNKVSDKLIDLSLDFLFQTKGGGAGAGVLGGLTKLFGGLFQGPTASTAWAPTVTPFAKGGEFTNGVYNSPQLFKFAAGDKFGVMGEAGPEAVMPLKRGPDGSLGVEMHGANDNRGPAVIVQVINNAPNTTTREERSQNGDGSEVRKIIIDTVRQGMADGDFDTTQRARFGATPSRVIR